MILSHQPIIFTSAALKELMRLRKTLSLGEDNFLRIGIKGAGCTGTNYLLAFDKKEDQDNTYVIQEISVIIHKSHLMHILGLQVDFWADDNNKGFVFENPTLKSTNTI
jgi:iron-sulfur cluster assembly protein